MTKITQTAFAALDTAATPPHICHWTISVSAYLVRDKIGRAWEPSDPKTGWAAAKIEGMRVVKVAMTVER